MSRRALSYALRKSDAPSVPAQPVPRQNIRLSLRRSLAECRSRLWITNSSFSPTEK